LYRYFVSLATIILCVTSQRVFVVIVVDGVIDSVRKLLDTPRLTPCHGSAVMQSGCRGLFRKK